MKLNSKPGATLAAAAATLFLAGSVVSTVSTPANAAQGKCMAGNACKGQSDGHDPRDPACALRWLTRRRLLHGCPPRRCHRSSNSDPRSARRILSQRAMAADGGLAP